MIWMITLIMMVMMIVMGVIVGLIYTDNVEMNHRLNVLEGEVLVLRDMLHQVSFKKKKSLKVTNIKDESSANVVTNCVMGCVYGVVN